MMANRLLLNPNGLKISRPGVDVLTASLANDFLFNSDFMLPSLLMHGTTVIPKNSNVVISYPFALDVIPFFSGLIQVDSTWEHIGRAERNGTTAICRARTTRSYLQLEVINPSGPFNVRYSLWVT